MIKIICIGKLKEKYLQELQQEYVKRLTRYTKLEIIELPDVSFDDINKIKKTEGIDILKHIQDKDYVITMEIEGKEMSSIQFANYLSSTQIKYSNITLIIGGSYGISDEVKERANDRLSFSKLTFPHQLFRIMILEQLYRSYKIKNNETYHK